MQFQVPQFIEIEDKIFGPFTLKQFIYLAGGAGISFIIYNFLGLFWGLFLIGPVIAFAFALAFYKVNSKPFINVVEAGFKYYLNDKLYIWKKEQKIPTRKVIEEKENASLFVPKLSDSKLKDLAWSLDIHGVMETQTRDRMDTGSSPRAPHQ